MAKTLLMLAICGVIAFFLIKALIHFWHEADRLEDEDYEIRNKAKRDFNTARDDLRRETDRANAKKKGKKK